MKLNKKVWMAIFFVGILLLLENCSYAGTQELNSLDYAAQLNSDGSMDVVETWDIHIRETNTLFKDFYLDENKYSGITNVKVKDLDTGKDLTEISTEMYHVTKNCYYGLQTSYNQFEIAWGVGLDNSSATKKYQISYTIEDAITVHEDCSELYWQFIGTDNAIPAKKVTGKILLPEAVKEAENLKIWAHGPLNGEIHKISNREVTFLVEDFRPETMLEVRVITEENLFGQSIKYSYQDALEQIMKEEKMWAEHANQQRNRDKILTGVIVLVGVFYIFKMIKYVKILNSILKEQQKFDIGKYFRDIPRKESATPAEAAFLLRPYNESSVFSATLLQLCLKGYISFDTENVKNIKINLRKKESIDLKLSEKNILELLQEIAGISNESLTMEEIKKFAKEDYTKFGDVMKKIQKGAKDFYCGIDYYDLKKEKRVNQYGMLAALYILGIVILISTASFVIFPCIWTIVAEWLICSIILIMASNKEDCLTQQGRIEKQEWKGLKNYMIDFSMLKDREVPHLVLWEQYLVYATAFGISEKVIKQLKVVYPQLQDLDSNTYRYLYLMSDTRFSNGFINEFNKSTSGIYSAYVASLPSSSSGSGGGFSSGGGGRWRRRPEWAADKIEMGEKMKIGIDIGGSHIGIGFIKGSKIVAVKEKNFNREDRKHMEETILISIQELMDELLWENQLKMEQVELIGIAAPGTISNGIMVKAGNLGLHNFKIIEKLQKIYNNPMQIRNDGKCAALAEKAYGAMKNYEDCVFINIGTGIGGAAFLGGKLLEPKRYSGFEFGHMILNKGGRLCSCGKQGCFEAYSSIKALKNKVTETLDVDSDISGKYLREELLTKKDPRVKEDIEVFLEYLKTGISNLIDIFEPEVVCLGGSFAYYEGNPIFVQLLEKLHEPTSLFNAGDFPQIVMAEFKNDAGIIGAVIE